MAKYLQAFSIVMIVSYFFLFSSVLHCFNLVSVSCVIIYTKLAASRGSCKREVSFFRLNCTQQNYSVPFGSEKCYLIAI